MLSAQQTGHEELAQTRLAVYRFLFAALSKPTPGQHIWMAGPDFRSGLGLLCEEFGLPCPEGELVPGEYADHESRYLACFEVGLPGPPVPLLASHYHRKEPAPRIIHEHVLFYKRFGTRPADTLESADHLLDELAFLVRLDELLLAGRMEAESVLHGRRDFLARQGAQWPARAAALAHERGLPPVYRTLLALLAVAVEQDLALSEAAVADLAKENS
ncbi:MAG TPA: molecular chaperone TorD family protein [Gemmataceae bacterium]|nr:molecular chaperone TorD family protein [Gemmataceae bacterium]